MNNILSVLENFSLDNADDIAIRMAILHTHIVVEVIIQ